MAPLDRLRKALKELGYSRVIRALAHTSYHYGPDWWVPLKPDDELADVFLDADLLAAARRLHRTPNHGVRTVEEVEEL